MTDIHTEEKIMSMKISRIDGLKFKAEYSGHAIVSGRIDEEHESEGMNPGSILMAALGLCTATRTIEQMMKRGWEAKGLELTIKSKYDKGLNRATSFELTIDLEADLTEDQRKEILFEAKRCFVANTLKSTPEISYKLNLV
jgi:uncharacterized OsmC-like protein